MEGAVVEVVRTIESFSLEAVDPDRVFVEVEIVKNIYLLGLLCDL